MKWSPVYHVSTIFGNHVTAGVLWVKMTFLPACKQTKWRPDRTKFGGEIVSQTRVPPVSTPMNNLFSTPRVNRDIVRKTKLSFRSCVTILSIILSEKSQIHDLKFSSDNPWSAKPDICRFRGVGSLYCFPRSPKNDFNNTEQV